MTRLETISRELANALKEAVPETRRAVVLRACERAIEISGLEEPLAVDGLLALQMRKPFQKELEDALVARAAALDEEYLHLKDREDIPPSEGGGYLGKFSQARATSALATALAQNSVEAAGDVVYEATASFEDGHVLLRELMSMLTHP
jgi:hypothetical protein